jgi:hypothetical protein
MLEAMGFSGAKIAKIKTVSAEDFLELLSAYDDARRRANHKSYQCGIVEHRKLIQEMVRALQSMSPSEFGKMSDKSFRRDQGFTDSAFALNFSELSDYASYWEAPHRHDRGKPTPPGRIKGGPPDEWEWDYKTKIHGFSWTRSACITFLRHRLRGLDSEVRKHCSHEEGHFPSHLNRRCADFLALEEHAVRERYDTGTFATSPTLLPWQPLTTRLRFFKWHLHPHKARMAQRKQEAKEKRGAAAAPALRKRIKELEARLALA